MEKELSKKLLEVLACPICKTNLIYKKTENKLVCEKCSREYNIKNGVPIMLVTD